MRSKKSKEEANMFGHSVTCQHINTIIIPPKSSTIRPLLTIISIGTMQDALDQKIIIISKNLGILISPQGSLKILLKQFLMASTPKPDPFALLVTKKLLWMIINLVTFTLAKHIGITRNLIIVITLMQSFYQN